MTFTRWFTWLRRLLDSRSRTIKTQTSQRVAWDKAAKWYRLRYEDPEQAQIMLSRLSRASKRVAIRFRNQEYTMCFVGVDPGYTHAFKKMLSAFNCQADPILAYEKIPAPITSMFHLETEVFPIDASQSDAYIIEGRLFATVRLSHVDVVKKRQEIESTKTTELRYFPDSSHLDLVVVAHAKRSQTTDPTNSTNWIMPEPVIGTGAKLHLTLPTPQKYIHNASEWLLGVDSKNRQVGGNRVGLVGMPENINNWIYSLVHNNLTRKHLLVIDGSGFLIDRLTSKPHIQHMIKDGKIALMDGNAPFKTVFNPIPVNLSHSLDDSLKEWSIWLTKLCGSVGETKDLIEFLRQGHFAGVRDLFSLYRWCRQIKEEHPRLATPILSGLQNAIHHEWFQPKEGYRPIDPRVLIQTSNIFFTPREKTPLNAMVTLGLLQQLSQLPIQVILHDIKLDDSAKKTIRNKNVIVTKTFADTTIFVRCTSAQAVVASESPYLKGAINSEQLELLPMTSGILVEKGTSPTLIKWRR